MPYFLDNKGCCVMPSLETLAMMAEGLTEDKLNTLAPHVKKLTKDMHRRLDYKIKRTARVAPVYLASDITALAIPCHSMEVNLSYKSQEEVESFNTADRAGNYNSANKDERSKVKRYGGVLRSNIEAVIYVVSDVKYVRLRPGRGNKLALEITSNMFDQLVDEGVNWNSVKRLFTKSPNDRFISCFTSAKFLSSLDCIVSSLDEFDALLALRHTLRELRIIFQLTSVDLDELALQDVLNNFCQLQLLFVALPRYLQIQPEQRIETWNLPSSLRSLGFRYFSDLEAESIIQFLTQEVEYRGEMVPRQALLDDLTIIATYGGLGVSHGERRVLETVYSSEALTQRMKERIYSNIDRGHYAAASKLLAARHESFFVIGPNHCYESIDVLLEKLINPQSYFSVVCEHLQYLTRNSYRREGFAVPLTKCLRENTFNILRTLDPIVLGHLLDVNTGWTVKTYEYSVAALIVKHCEHHEVTASNTVRYLGLVAPLLICPREEDELVPLFMKYLRQLTPLEQRRVIQDNEEKLICFFLRLIVAAPGGARNAEVIADWTLLDEVELSTPLFDLINLARMYARGDWLYIVCNAVLRRTEEGSVSGKWTDAFYAAEKEKSLRQLFPCLVELCKFILKRPPV